MAYTVPTNGTFFEKGALLRVAAKNYDSAMVDAMKPGGGNFSTANLVAAKAALDAAHTAMLAAMGAAIPSSLPIINPAIGYGSMTGAPGVKVVPNP